MNKTIVFSVVIGLLLIGGVGYVVESNEIDNHGTYISIPESDTMKLYSKNLYGDYVKQPVNSKIKLTGVKQ